MGKRKEKNKGKPRKKIIGEVFKTSKGGLRSYPGGKYKPEKEQKGGTK